MSFLKKEDIDMNRRFGVMVEVKHPWVSRCLLYFYDRME